MVIFCELGANFGYEAPYSSFIADSWLCIVAKEILLIMWIQELWVPRVSHLPNPSVPRPTNES